MILQQVILFAKDLPRLAEFYGMALGLTPIPETQTATWVEFVSGAVRFALHAIPPHIAADISIASPPAAREDTPLKLIFTVPDLAAAGERLQTLGATLLPRLWGGLDALDPEGNVFGLIQQATQSSQP